MPSFHPRAELATHEVSNQPQALGDVALMDDPALQDTTARAFDRLTATGTPITQDHLQEQNAHLTAFGAKAGSETMRDLGRQAEENPPKLHAFNAQGQRIDEIEFHPAWHDLMALGLKNGVSSRAWTHPHGGHITHGALMAMMSWTDGGVCCPISMTYAVTSVLKEHDWTADEWLPRVTTADYDPRVLPAGQKSAAIMGMAMTEKQGGSDLRANSTRATALGDDEVELTGHKWFCSAPMCDAFLTLAYEDAGLSCFLVPRWKPDGTRNPMEIQRLKNKMGDRSNASSEIEYRGAWARRVGEPGRGIPTIIVMAHHTRYDCITGSAGAMRKSVVMAANHVAQRTAFQRKLIDQPLMRHVLADLALETEAALALAMRVGTSFDAATNNDHEAALSRVLTPIAKYWVCKRQPGVIAEALECFGGIGFVEEVGMARLFRTSPLNAIWEGSGNVIALDIQRALGDERIAAAFTAEITRIGDEIQSLKPLTDWIAQTKDADPRLFAERAAIVFSADALPAGPVRDAYITLRLMAPSHLWGANAEQIDCDLLVDRAVGWV
ncbi:MAG: acyl-CoA dehydrogenase family protein [Robiginitomaculum sp.]|nr:acyl-CoA dehydrogenase family protein [Robiginitomaculum sp.]MDQ7077558.1 acyl-CoA dehydrogenase family protein [Robiginitomaculum sp.]